MPALAGPPLKVCPCGYWQESGLVLASCVLCLGHGVWILGEVPPILLASRVVAAFCYYAYSSSCHYLHFTYITYIFLKNCIKILV